MNHSFTVLQQTIHRAIKPQREMPMPKYPPFSLLFFSAILCFTFLLGTAIPGPAHALSTLPEAFDLRDVDGKAYIGPVKDQSPLGTCYSFAAAAVAESTYNRAMNQYDDNAISLSESFIVWSLGQKYAGFGGRDQGANYDYDELQAMVDYGDCTEEEFPYTSDYDTIEAYHTDTNHELDYHWDAPRIQFAGWHRLPTNDIETIKRAIMTFGAVDAAVDVTNKFQAYTDGIFSDNATTADNPLEYFTGTNHAISLVGWADNSTGDGTGSWILRNSWDTWWGEDGYMRIGYTSARVATSITYLHYKKWNDYGFDHIDVVNTGTITAGVNATGYQPVSRGMYAWGDDTSSLINNGTITATAEVTDAPPYVHGMFLWAGNASRIENNGILNATASTDAGQATAYGVCLQGHEITNTGTISVNATSADDRATAYGARFFSFDENGTFENSGSITARAEGDDGWAYGLLSTDAETVLNAGNMTATGNGYAIGILAEGPTDVINQNNLLALTSTGEAYGIAVYYTDSVTNNGTILSQASGSNGRAVGISGEEANRIENIENITAQANAVNGTACGIQSYGADTLTNTGVLSVQADLESIGIASSESESASNTGIINATATNYAKGIDSAWDSLVSNTGTITARTSDQNSEALGISAYRTKTIKNQGTVNAISEMNATGIQAQRGTELTNNGTISAWTNLGTASGVNMDAGTLINETGGVINATTATGTAYGVYLVDSLATNAGTIQATGPAGTDIYAVYLSASKLLNNGLVEGNTYVGEKSILGGYGQFDGDVINDAGTVAPGNSIGTLTINGDYIQGTDGVLEIEFNNTASDQLIVTQTADLQEGSLNLVPLGYTNGITTQFLNATTLNGTVSDITVISPAVFAYSLTSSNNKDLTLGITRNTYASLGSNEGERGVAGALDQIRPSATGEMYDILNGLDTLQRTPLQNALNDMTPGMHAAASYASIQNTHRSMSYVRRHWKDLQTEAGRDDTPYEPSQRAANGTRFNAWGSFLGASSKTKTQDNIPGYNESMTGLVLGMDYKIGPKLTTGLAGSYTRQSLNQEDGSGDSAIKTFRGYVYGLWDENPETEGLYVSTALGLGTIHFDTDRDIQFLNREAESDHRGQDYSLLATTGYDIENGNWTIRPNLNLEYVFLHEKGYDESDAGDMNLHVDAHDSQSLQSVLGISVARRCRLKKAVLIPELRLAWMHEFMPDQDDLTSRFLAAGPSFDTPSRDIPKDAAVLGLGIKAPLSDRVFAAIDYECTLTEANESTDHRFNAQVRIRF